jgi:hypothetical protein
VDKDAQLSKIRGMVETNMKHLLFQEPSKCVKPDVWQHVDFDSTDCGEDNDEIKTPSA